MNENKIQTNNEDIKVLRTYTSDMAEAIRNNELSVIKIALAEKEKSEKETGVDKTNQPDKTKKILLIGGIVLIIIAIVVSYFIFQKKKIQDIPKTAISSIETFIAYDSFSDIDVTNILDTNSLVNIIKQQNNSGSINSLFLKKGNGSSLLKSNEFLSLIKTTAPGALTRSLSDKYLLGQYKNINDLNKKDTPFSMFLIFETNNYNQAYSSMLDWEKTMSRDLFELFNLDILNQNNSLTGKAWRDVVVNNKDTRVLYGGNGEGVLYYTFVNKNDFVIANNLEALKAVISRIIIKN